MHGKCPRCRQGDMFVYPVSRVTRFYKMHDQCPVCGISLTPEPGFYQGAMYVGYAFTIAILVVTSIILYMLGDPSHWVYVITYVSLMLLLAPMNYRWSRVIYLYLFGGIKFDPNQAR